MTLKKPLVVLSFLLNVSHLFAEGVRQLQILPLINALGRHFENGFRAIRNGDVYTACSEGREAARAFN
jgi:hypothetical protein